jgi:spore coat protein H
MKSISYLLIAFLLLSYSSPVSSAIPPQEKITELRIYISKNQFSSLLSTSEEKMELSKPIMLIDLDTANVKEIHARGNNSLKFKRKSLSVELDKSFTVRYNKEKIHLKKFDLLNLVMDKHLWHNRWSDLNLETIGLFPLYNFYCKLWINDEPQGIFLLIEKPQQAQTKLKSPYMLRRGPNHTITDDYFQDSDKEAAKKYKKQFQSIYSIIKSPSETEQVEQLSKVINLDNYFRFLAFNYLVMNGDYADEVFFYIEPKSQLFELIPWDYDDILKPMPHEGRAERNREFADKKMFSLEESFDRAIAGNKELYALYEQSFRKMLLTLDSTSLTTSAHHVLNELEQLSHDKPMAEVTLFLDLHPFDMVQAREDILQSLDFVLRRRKWILEGLQ